MAYVRKKKVGKYEYYQLVEGKRVDGKVRQRVIAHLGKHDSIEAARQAAAGVASKSADVEQEGRYWITYPYRLGYDPSSLKPLCSPCSFPGRRRKHMGGLAAGGENPGRSMTF